MLFDYLINEKIDFSKKSKYSYEIIVYLKIIELCNNDAKIYKIKIKEEYDIKISTNTLKSFWC